jgi:FPC/CPF motif-containing protein YcgG
MNLSQQESTAVSDSSPVEHIHAFIDAKRFPCVGAKSALNKDRLHVGSFGAFGSTKGTERLWDALKTYSENYPDPGQTPVSFIATFEKVELDELGFEALMWAQLQSLHELDCSKGFKWDRKVSDDPAKAEFSFSVAGRAFFVVGLHPGASRKARQTPFPCLVFNFHDQFEELKASGKYSSMQAAIRKRDTALQGSVNPMLSRFGEASEAIQYSGRAVQEGWQCPFHKKEFENA